MCYSYQFCSLALFDSFVLYFCFLFILVYFCSFFVCFFVCFQSTSLHEGEFYGLRPSDARCAAYIIRTLHKDFDPITGSSSALMQAALSNVDLPTGVSEALSSLEMLSSIDARPALPNGTVFQKTQVKHPRTHQTGAPATTGAGSTIRPSSSSARKMNSTSTAGGKSMKTSVGTTMQVRPTMIAPRTRVSMHAYIYIYIYN